MYYISLCIYTIHTIYVCIYVLHNIERYYILESEKFLLFLVPRDSLVHWGSKQARYLCPAGFLDTTSLHPGRIFLVRLYIFVCFIVCLFVCLCGHLLRRMNLSNPIIYVQQVFSIQQACALVNFFWYVCIFLFV